MLGTVVFSKEFAGLACVIAAVVGLPYVAASLSPRTVEFKHAQEFKDFAVARGLHFHPGTLDEGMTFAKSNFYVADHRISTQDLEGIGFKRDCGLTPAWRGVVWIAQIEDTDTPISVETIGGRWRIWGNVVVAGDEDLMDRIEAMRRAE